MHHFTTVNPPRLTIELRAGAITIDTVDGADTTVDLLPRHDSAGARDVIARTTIDQRGDEIVVLAPRRFGGLVGRSADLELTITAPHGAALSIDTGSADIVATGRFSTTRINSGSGDVSLGELTDSARLRTGSGDIRVQAVGRDLDVQTGSGNVELGSVAGDASVQSGSGDIRVDSGGHALRAKTGSGDVAIGASPDDLRVNTGSGDIRIDAVARGEVKVKAASGDIRTGVRRGTAAWLDVRTISGRVTSGLEAGGEPVADEEQVRLQLETVSGDIDVVRV